MEATKDMKKFCLTVNFDYFDEQATPALDFIDPTNEKLTARGALKLSLNPMDSEDANLTLDLYDNLKDDKDVTGLLKDYFDKKYTIKQTKESEEVFSPLDFEEWWNDK